MEPKRKPTDSVRPPSRWVVVVAFILFIATLIAGLEVAARVLTRLRDDPVVHRIARDYGRLAESGASWIRFVPDPELSYRLRPGFELLSERGGGITRHNRDGFRNLRDFSPKPAGVLRIACYGASTTYGVSVSDNRDTYPAQLEAILNGPEGPPGLAGVEVWNLGVGGYTSREILGTMQRTLGALDPDIVLIQSAINDVIPRFYPDYRADYSHFRTSFTPLDVGWFESVAYRSYAWLTLAHGLGWVKPLSLQSQTQRPMPPVAEALANLAQQPPAGFEQNLRAAVALAAAEGRQVWLLTQPYLDIPAFAGPTESVRRLEQGYRQGLTEHTDIVIRIAEETDARLIPLHASMPRDRVFFSDPIHMTVAGNRVKAEKVAEALLPDLPVPRDG